MAFDKARYPWKMPIDDKPKIMPNVTRESWSNSIMVIP